MEHLPAITSRGSSTTSAFTSAPSARRRSRRSRNKFASAALEALRVTPDAAGLTRGRPARASRATCLSVLFDKRSPGLRSCDPHPFRAPRPMSLSSLIVQREIATIRQVEEALARQVLYGGDLVTNLLEVAKVDEGEVTELLAESIGIPPAPSGELPPPSDRARAMVPPEMASE